ncbi:MAG TPA: hypothetical protein VFG69_11370, partial [Nannocystaceae bacterium]|nr:hypothetical protein [Nannocystaceae bacterium]
LRAGLFATPFGPGYYSGFTDRTGLLAVREPKWHVKMWKEVDGEVVEVVETTTTTPPSPKPTKAPCDCDEKEVEETWSQENRRSTWWAGVQVGTIITPFAPGGGVDWQKRVVSNQFSGAVVPKWPNNARALRGIDLRIHGFRILDDKFPSWVTYFRTGFGAGYADFRRDQGFEPGMATALSYVSVPLFFGASFYPIKNFFLRPYFGLGFGLDVIKLAYHRDRAAMLERVVARPGFELHAGLEARITNYVALSFEIMQEWSARKKIDNAPDFSNEGFTIITGVAISIPVKKPKPQVVKRTRTTTTRTKPADTPPPAAAPAETPPPAAEPAATPPAEPTPAPTAAPASEPPPPGPTPAPAPASTPASTPAPAPTPAPGG